MKDYTTLHYLCLVGITLTYLWLMLIDFVITEQMRCVEKELMKISTHLKFLAGQTRNKYDN